VSIKHKANSRLSPEFALLGFLFEHPDHGYELHRRLHDVFGNIWHASQSQSYNILKRLETQGYISATEVEQDKLPPRQILEITEMGRRRFTEWLNQPTKSSVHAIRVEFLTRLYFSEHYYPENVRSMIQAQIKVVEDGVNELQRISTSLPEKHDFDRLAIELRIELLNSVIGWLNGCQRVLMGVNSSEEAA
jgi:DNA-binding PadR family transcriptional regulator